MPAPLEGIRVVDRTDSGGELCGRILADLGAEVLKIEPPEGCAARRRPPFARDTGESLWWRAFGRGKRSVVLDLDDPVDQHRYDRLLAGADVLVQTARGPAVAALGSSAHELVAAHQALIVSCITPYGLDGPRAGWPATDLTIEAASGRLMLQGDADRPPVPMGFPQSGPQGAGAAASDIVIALYERDRSGRGQVLDTSMQVSVTWTLMNATGYGAVTADDPSSTDERRGEPRPELSPGVAFPGVEQVADGWVSITPPLLGQVTVDGFSTLIDWVADDGQLPDDLCDRRWGTFLTDIRAGDVHRDDAGRMVTALRTWLLGQTKASLHRRAVAERVLVAPVATGSDLLADPQLAARSFWTDRGGVAEAGPWARLSATPLTDPSPAPALGADQSLVEPQRVPAVPADPDRPGRGPVFAGLRVADLTWAGVGPFITKALADQGATTVKVESAAKPDQMRMVPPYRDGAPALENTHAAPNFNTNKLSLGVDLGTSPGREILHRLVGWADIVVENMTPGALDRLGIGYADLAGGRPELIMLSTSLRGQTGPERTYTGFGQQGAALSGFWSITGWP
ncbi:MAG: CoA transferase, partial [Acidimicrobiia bacterium]|nr:CoA transferase [Acidimicrobiia bacterium]